MKTKLFLLLFFSCFFIQAQTPHTSFPFNGSLSASVGSGTFTSTGTTFVTDRHGNPESALNISNSITATLSNLGTSATSRTISLWFRNTGGFANSPTVFYYGQFANSQLFSMNFNTNGQLVFQDYLGAEIIDTAVISQNNWYHLVITTSGNEIKVYLNGELKETFNRYLNTGSSPFLLGNFQGDIDDLTFFYGALNQNQISNLYYYNGQPQIVTEYGFDNSYNNINGNTPFVSNSGTSFVTDRYGNTESAININNTGLTATITGLPYGDMPRTISLWTKLNTANSNYNFLYSYGTAGNPEGAYINPGSAVHFLPNNTAILTHSTDVWYHFVFTYDGMTSRIYRNGTLMSSPNVTKNTLNNSDTFSLGLSEAGALNFFNGAIDDLKIYNYALTSTDVADLYADEVPVVAPIVSYVSESVSFTMATIGYTISSNSLATSVIKYGLTDTDLSSQVNGFSANGVVTNSITIEDLLSNTTYYYRIEATNSAGITLGSVESFTTLPQEIIAEYNFNNTYNNINGNAPFTGNAGTSFVTDRHGNTENAININNTGTIAVIEGLPLGNNQRTISFWAKANVLYGNYNMTFSYGNSEISQANGGSFNVEKVEYFGGWDNFYATAVHSANTWYHFVYTYDGITAKIYTNGTLTGQADKSWNTTSSNNQFRLGIGVGGEYQFNGAIDDLKIYNYALSNTEVGSLYDDESMSTIDLETVRFKIYPNPANDLVNIQTESEIKSVEVFNIQGQKVVTSNQNQINISDLSSGIYMVKVTDENNLSSIQKIIKK